MPNLTPPSDLPENPKTKFKNYKTKTNSLRKIASRNGGFDDTGWNGVSMSSELGYVPHITPPFLVDPPSIPSLATTLQLGSNQEIKGPLIVRKGPLIFLKGSLVFS